MYFTSRTGCLSKLENGQATALLKGVKDVINTNPGCLFLTETGIYNQDRKPIAKPGSFYRMPDGRVMIREPKLGSYETFGYRPYLQYAIFRNIPGELVFFTDSVCVYRGQDTYKLRKIHCDEVDLFPANRHVTFVDRVTPLDETVINIHTLHFSEGRIIAEVFRVGQDWVQTYYAEEVMPEIVEPDEVIATYTAYRVATYFVMKSGVVCEYDHNGPVLSVAKFQNFRVVDRLIISYDGPTPIAYDMGERLAAKNK